MEQQCDSFIAYNNNNNNNNDNIKWYNRWIDESKLKQMRVKMNVIYTNICKNLRQWLEMKKKQSSRDTNMSDLFDTS